MVGEAPALSGDSLRQIAEAAEPFRDVMSLWLVTSDVSYDDGEWTTRTEAVLDISPDFNQRMEDLGEADPAADADLIIDLYTALKKAGITVHGWLRMRDTLRQELPARGVLVYRRSDSEASTSSE